jgi:imidazolonepropionase-like amidohydrolase
VQVLDAAGVTVLAGTDGIMAFQNTGFSLHDELALLVKAGLSEMRALQAATRNPAQVFNVLDQGTIEQGKRADLVLLDASPLENIENTRRSDRCSPPDACSTEMTSMLCWLTSKRERVNGRELQRGNRTP